MQEADHVLKQRLADGTTHPELDIELVTDGQPCIEMVRVCLGWCMCEQMGVVGEWMGVCGWVGCGCGSELGVWQRSV